MARFALFEDREVNREIFLTAAQVWGHEVVALAKNMAEARETVEAIAGGSVPTPDAYVVDSCLGETLQDGLAVIAHIRQLGLVGQILGYSATPWVGGGVDADMTKNAIAVMRIGSEIDQHLQR
jgi:CheY-like chemotaxis protein